MSTLAPSRWPLDVLPEAVRQELLDGAPALALEAGQVLYRWGDSATSFFVVREGQLELRVKARTSDAVEAKPVATGCVVGIEALLADRDHLEEARAAGPAVVIEIGRGRFERARRDLLRARRRIADFVKRLRKTVKVVDRLRLGVAGDHRQVRLPMR